jgi:iron complex transport system permease protein
MLLRYSFLPRFFVSLLAGAGLGIASFLFQQLLRNPLADPASLGIAAGASLAMVIVSVWVPTLLAFGQEWVALGGGFFSFLLVMVIGGPTTSPVRLISAGLVISMLCGSINAVLTLYHGDFLQNVFIWSSGSLNQNNWEVVDYLVLRVAGAAIITCVFQRPLFVLSLGDDQARNLGLPIAAFRIASLIISVGLSCTIVSAVGIIGFVGMAAPIISRLMGFRRPMEQMLISTLVGAMILASADQVVQLVANAGKEIPTGVMTAVIGSPLLMMLLPRLKDSLTNPGTDALRDHSRRIGSEKPIFFILLLMLLSFAVAALFLGQNQHGWHWAGLAEFKRYLPWRWPRMISAFCAGAMLGVAGAALQRLTRNPMASPEILGISSGASLGVIISIFMNAGNWPGATFAAACTGAAVTLFGMLVVGRRFSFSPERTLLLGIAFGTAFSALSTILMSSGDPRFSFLLAWMAGSTYGITGTQAFFSVGSALILVPLTVLTHRWIGLLSLGEVMSREAGIAIGRARGTILLLSAGLTAASILLIGPLSFVGLIGPHLATAIGLRRPLHHLLGGMLLGGLVMIAADWLGRNLLFPYQIPAGLLAALVGGPYFLLMQWGVRR